MYLIDRYSPTKQKRPASDAKPVQNQAGNVGLTDVQTLVLGYGVLCTGAVVGWRFWRSLRPTGSYLADVRASPHGFLHWRGGQPRMFSFDNSLGRTFLGTTCAGLLLVGAALVDERADSKDDDDHA